MSTLAGPAVAAYPVLNAEQRRTLIQRVSNVVNERIWDPAFQRDRWRDAVDRCRESLMDGVGMEEFEQRMDALVRAGRGFPVGKEPRSGILPQEQAQNPRQPIGIAFPVLSAE